MDLLERYLQAVGRSLPLTTREDTLAELRANLLAQLDAQQEATGHAPTQPEIEALLLHHGHPAVVASRYLPQRSLIGPELFPFYVLTLRRAMPLVVFISLIAYTVAAVAMREPPPFSVYAVQSIARFIPVLLTWWATVTAIFALVEYSKGKLWNGNLAGAWKPSSLPALHGAPDRASLAKRIADFAMHCLLTAYLLATPFHPFLLLGPGVWYLSAMSLALSPPWHTIYTALLGLLIAQLFLKAIMLFGPGARWQRPLELSMKLLGTAIIVWVIVSDFHLVATGNAVDPRVLAALNRGIQVACRLALIINVADILWSAWKYVQSPQARRLQLL